MWPRVVELMLGCWLLLTAFIFRGTPQLEAFVVNDAVAGGIVVICSLLCYWRPTRRAHVVTLLVGLGLAAYGYFVTERPGPPAAQNDIMVGLLLFIFAIIPTEASLPPEPWRRAREGRVQT